MAETESDPRVTKRRVTMTSLMAGSVEGEVRKHEAVDYVRPDHLDAYVEDARKNWQSVTVSDEPDAGPGGYDGATSVPEHLALPDAGVVYPASDESNDSKDGAKS